MAGEIDPKNGFCKKTKIFHSLKPSTPLPPPGEPLSIAEFLISLFHSCNPNKKTINYMLDSNTGKTLSFSKFLNQSNSLSSSLKTCYPLSQNDVAFIICPSSFHIPLLYMSLFSLGVTVSPANPLSSNSEIAHQIQLTQPKIAFATSKTAYKIPSLPLGTILIDSPEFLSFLNNQSTNITYVNVKQSDSAAIFFSSGTGGKIKGVSLTHRNMIALFAKLSFSGFYYGKEPSVLSEAPMTLFMLPMFHIFGFFLLFKAFVMKETLVLMEKFDFEAMLRAIEKYKINSIPVSPSLIVNLIKSELTKKYDLTSLLLLTSGGAPLGNGVYNKFKEKFPRVEIWQGYGLTEGGGVTKMVNQDIKNGSVGVLVENIEARVVDHVTGEGLLPAQTGELRLRGPTIMKGYIRDEKATAETLDSEGWLKTGDLCYIDSQGFMYIVDRLKELIKYKAYQVPPAELEQLLMSHPEIIDAAVIPYPDKEAGQIPMAYIVRKPGSHVTESQIMDFVSKQVAPYRKIRRIAFTSAIPKSAAGKVLRKELVDLAVSNASPKL